VTFDVLKMVTMKSTVFLDVALSNLIKVYQFACSAYSLLLKIEVVHSTQTSVTYIYTATCNIQENSTSHKLRVFENRVLRRILEPKAEVVGGWRKLHNEKLHNLYPSPKVTEC
jgi:hypothetical protein